MAIPRPRGDRPAPVRAGATRRTAGTGYFASRCKAAPRRRKIVGDRRCGQAIEGLPDPWPDPAHREAVAAASGQVEGKTMATIGSFAKVLRWHWSARNCPSGQCQDAYRSRIEEDGQWPSAFGRRPGRDRCRLEEDRAGCGRFLASARTVWAEASRSARAARIEGDAAFNLI